MGVIGILIVVGVLVGIGVFIVKILKDSAPK
jgi:hypothetical protein